MSNGIGLRDLKRGDGHLVGPSGKYDIYNEGQTACSMACPAGVDIKAYVNLIADRKYEDAVRVIRRANPFPGICGRVCTHPCEADCGRSDIDEAVSIKALKRFAADYELSRKKPGTAPEKLRAEKIAIVGSGPAGLTAAMDLALAGFHVTVFESSDKAGGLMSWGIPDFRLPKNILRSEIKDIQVLGVTIITGKKIDKPAELLKKGYSAVILATGCQRPILAGIPGEDWAVDCLDFLRNVSEGGNVELGSKLIVVGGGNAALDSARTALRLGKDVVVAYRRTEEQMPADPEEIAHAREEGIKFEFLAIPVEIKPGKSMRFQRAKLGEPDASGRRTPIPITNDFFDIPADNVIMAIGSKADVSGFTKAMKLNKNGTPVVSVDFQTSVPGIFAAGDIATGPSSIVDAIGSGHDAAAGVIAYITGNSITYTEPGEMLVVESPLSAEVQRCASCFIPLEKRQSTFDEAEIGMAERDAITEALRCRRCGSCTVCDVCLAVCDYRNALVSVPETGESALAKVPFDVAAAAMDKKKMWKLELGKDKTDVTIQPLLAKVDEKSCISCGKCEEACPYKAIRTVFDTAGNAVARVEESACRGCGACVAACPAGAMTMRFPIDELLHSEIRNAVKHSSENSSIVRFSCMWNRQDADNEPHPWEVRAQCTRRLSPALLVETLALGARGVVVVGCEEDECHYLPGPWMGPDVVESSKDILRAIGISPDRISYSDDLEQLEDNIKKISALEIFASLPKDIPQARAGLGRCLNYIQILMAQPDARHQPKGKILLGCGCLAMSEPAFVAYGIQGHDVLDSAKLLLLKAEVKYEMAHGLHTTGSKLKDWGMESLHASYTGAMAKTLKDSGADVIVIPTPKSYESFKKMGLKCQISSLPAILKDKLSGKFLETHTIVAYHPVCSGGGDFDEDSIKLLGEVPGLKLVKLEGECGDSGWMDVTAESAKLARGLLKRAETAGAEFIVAGSTRCAAHLKATTAGWNRSPVKVMDIYTFLASRLDGDA